MLTIIILGYIDWAKVSMVASPQVFGVCAYRIGELMCRVQRFNQSMHSKNQLRLMAESILGKFDLPLFIEIINLPWWGMGGSHTSATFDPTS